MMLTMTSNVYMRKSVAIKQNGTINMIFVMFTTKQYHIH